MGRGIVLKRKVYAGSGDVSTRNGGLVVALFLGLVMFRFCSGQPYIR